MYTYDAALNLAVACVRRSIRQQVEDPGHPAHGAFLNEQNAGAFPSADHVSNAADLAVACQVFLAPGSPLEDDGELLRRISDSIGFQRRWQRPSGLIDLTARNIESPPDTGFTVEALARVVAAARAKRESAGARLIAERLGEYVRTAAAGMIDKGFHTPNHRWVVCAAIGLAMTLFPDIPGRDYVDRILAEGIDIQADGEYTERSNGIYNAVCNRCLIAMADSLERPELLEPVRRNLDFIAHMLRDDGSVETVYSTRQDRGVRTVPTGMADSYLEMAARDNNGIWASVADLLFDRPGSTPIRRVGPSLLAPFLARPRLRHERTERRPIPDEFRRLYAASGLWRLKRGPLSAIAMAGQRSVFAMQFGNVSLRGVKISGAYHGHAHVRPTEMLKTESGVRLLHYGRTTDFAGFFRPLNRPVAFGVFKEAEPLRETWSLPEMDVTVDIAEVDGGFDVCLSSSGGLDRVPMEIEFSFDGHGEWETADTIIKARPGQSAVLKGGYGTFRVEDEAISIGPGSFAHCDWNLRESQPTADAFRVLISFTAPFTQKKVELRYGHWSLARRGLL